VKVLVDTNVVLDVLLARTPFVKQGVSVFALVEASRIEASLCATTLTTIDYLLAQSLPRVQARHAIRGLLKLFEVAPVNRSVLERAIESEIDDFEDAVLEQAGCLIGADAIITRNTKDFRKSAIKAVDPVEFLSALDM